MELITHFSHRHQLRVQPRSMKYEICKICDELIDEDQSYWFDGYTCSQRCSYSIHRICAGLPEKQRHPFHPPHTLVLYGTEEGDDYRWYCCSLCRNVTYAFGYFCEKCNYVLDPKCAALAPIETQEGKTPAIHHQHPIFQCENPQIDHFYYSCQACSEDFEDHDHIFACNECKSLLHQVCASLPDKIRHPFHLEHPLTLVHLDIETSQRLKVNKCHACSRNPSKDIKMFHCFTCSFSLDVHCATLMPTAGNGNLTKAISGSHPDPLILCDNIKNFRRHCFGCNLRFEGSIYLCLDCSILLDQSCIDLLPHISHPFHPQHPLVLGRSLGCKGCEEQTGGFSYLCEDCKFVLDLKCATKRFQFIKYALHEHALAYFDFQARGGKCKMCILNCRKYFFHCVWCGFSVHDYCCSSLPQFIKHPCHCDPLTLTYSKIKDVSDEDECDYEFYCHACEEPRTLDHPTYYCANCHFIAHVHCVISEIIAHFQREETASANRVGNEDFSYRQMETSLSSPTEDVDMGGSFSNGIILHEQVEDANKNHIPQQPNKMKVESTRTDSGPISRESNKVKDEEKGVGCDSSTASDEMEGQGKDEDSDPYEPNKLKDKATRTDICNSASDQMEDEGQDPNQDSVLQELNVKIATLRNEVDALIAEIAKLEERRAQHISSAKN